MVKNTLARRAAKGTKLARLESAFEGTTAVALTENDAVALAKALDRWVELGPTEESEIHAPAGSGRFDLNGRELAPDEHASLCSHDTRRGCNCGAIEPPKAKA